MHSARQRCVADFRILTTKVATAIVFTPFVRAARVLGSYLRRVADSVGSALTPEADGRVRVSGR